jgi:cytochrome c553
LALYSSIHFPSESCMKYAQACLLSLALVSGSLLAKGDAKSGEQLAYTCTGCHGIPNYKNAYPSYKVPKIAGQNYEYLLAALNGYRDGTRSHPTMRAQAQSFSTKDIEDLATFLAAGDGAKP